jgi:hypothetical protein
MRICRHQPAQKGRDHDGERPYLHTSHRNCAHKSDKEIETKWVTSRVPLSAVDCRLHNVYDSESIKQVGEEEIGKEQKTNFATNKIHKKKERNKKEVFVVVVKTERNGLEWSDAENSVSMEDRCHISLGL